MTTEGMNPEETPFSAPTSFVLYVDDQNHPIPLVDCYHATAARSLCSTIPNRFPSTALSFVDSYYCAQCLRYYDSVQGSTEQSGSCPSCLTCPWCQSLVSVHSNKAISTEPAYDFFYQCENCDWTSQKHCRILSVTLSCNSNVEVGTMEFAKLLETASERLSDLLRQRRLQRTDSLFSSLLEQWKQYYLLERDKDPQNARSVLSRKPRDDLEPEEKWTIQRLEAKLQQIYQKVHDSSVPSDVTNAEEDKVMSSSSRIPSCKHISIQDLLANKKKDFNVDHRMHEHDWDDVSLFSLQSQLLVNPMFLTACARNNPQTEDVDDHSYNCWYPIAKPLDIRCSYRSKAEVLLYNRPGIILKPKLNPLDGDSSVPFGSAYGQWFRKDSSAMYVMPQIQIVQQRHFTEDVTRDTTTITSTQHFFLLQVTNPTLGAIRFRFKSSLYKGECDFWNDNEEVEPTATPVMRHVLVDTFNHTIFDEIHMLTSNSPQGELSTTTVELLPAEDSLLESTGGATMQHPTAVPATVRDWNPQWSSEEQLHSMRWIEHNASTAWLEVVTTATAPDTFVALGLPLGLEIELGNGSWESSLIPVEKDNDSVVFNVVLVWT